MSKDLVKDYVEFVQQAIEKFKSLGDLSLGNEVPPSKVFTAMADYYNTCLMLNAEYQREKISKIQLELDYEQVYAEWFQQARDLMILEKMSKSAKPSLKEIEQQVISDHKEDYFEWKQKLAEATARCDFYIRMRDLLNKYDSILTNMAQGLRSELRALNIENRASIRETHPRR